jgi:hypothetical protein
MIELCMLGVCTIVPACGTAQSAEPAERPTYRLPRFDEDWSFLRDAQRRSDWLDSIKFVPLGRNTKAYLSFGGELRETYERFHNPNFGFQPQDLDGYLLERYLVHLDVHIDSHARVFAEVVSALANWRNGGPRPIIDEDQFDFHQGFLEFASEDHGSVKAIVRMGRQELTLGSGRLLALREGTNVPASFDGIRVSARMGEWSADFFLAKPVSTRRGIADDPPQAGSWFWGVYGTRKERVFARSSQFDVYYFGSDRNPGVFNQGAAHETRHTLGGRIWNFEKAWNWDAEGMFQFGAFGTGNIRAFRIALDTSYGFPDVRWQPRVGFAADVASGDHSPSQSNLETFNALFQSGTYSGRAQILGPANTVRIEPSLSAMPRKRVSLSAGWGFYWRESVRDGLYGIAGNLLVAGNSTLARYEGSRPIFQLDWQVDRHFSLHANYLYVFNGPFGRQAVHGDSGMSYVSPWAVYRF